MDLGPTITCRRVWEPDENIYRIFTSSGGGSGPCDGNGGVSGSGCSSFESEPLPSWPFSDVVANVTDAQVGLVQTCIEVQ